MNLRFVHQVLDPAWLVKIVAGHLEALLTRQSLELEAALRHGLGTAFEPTFVDELIRKRHDILVHSILVRQIRDRSRVSFRESAEQADIESALFRLGVPHLISDHVQILGWESLQWVAVGSGLQQARNDLLISADRGTSAK